MSFRKHHGITMANNSWIENLNCERLTSDPVPLTAGRLWFNNTEKKLKYSSLDDIGAVVVRTFTDWEEVDQALTDHTTTMQTAIDASHAAINADIAALGNVFNYAGSVDGGVDSASAYDLDALPAVDKEIGDYHKVTTAGYFKWLDGTTQEVFANLNDGLVKNNVGGWDIIDNTNSVSNGTAGEITVSGSIDTGFVIAIDAAFKTRVSDAEAAIVSNDADIVSINGNVGTLASLVTSDKSNLVNAINEVQTEANANLAGTQANATAIAAEEAARIAADLVLTTNVATNATDISDETTRATAAEAALATNVSANSAAITSNDTDIAANTAAITSNDTDIAANTAAITAETSRATAAEGVNTAAIATNDTDIATNASDIATLQASAGNGADALLTQINGKVAIYTAASAQLSHSFVHNLVGDNLSVEIWAKDGNNWYNDSALVEMNPTTKTITVPLQTAAVIKIIVEDKTALV